MQSVQTPRTTQRGPIHHPARNMTRLAQILIVLAATVFWTGNDALAINNGQDDVNNYPNVGAIILDLGDRVLPLCSGTLVSDHALLTAAHCNAVVDVLTASQRITMDDVYVTFDPDPFADASWLDTNRIATHPDFTNKLPLFEDVGLLFLEEAVVGLPHAQLAPVGFLDDLADEGTISRRQRSEFTVVGYGTVRSFPEREYSPIGESRRRFAVNEFQALTPNNLILNQVQAPGIDNGGTCYGDSGGPAFWTDANGAQILTSVTSWGDYECVATDTRQRIDLETVRSFIDAELAAAAGTSAIAVPEPSALPATLTGVLLLYATRIWRPSNSALG